MYVRGSPPHIQTAKGAAAFPVGADSISARGSFPQTGAFRQAAGRACPAPTGLLQFFARSTKKSQRVEKGVLPPWPPLRGGSARRRWGRELYDYPKYFGLWQGSLPPPLRGTSLAEGGFSTVCNFLRFAQKIPHRPEQRTMGAKRNKQTAKKAQSKTPKRRRSLLLAGTAPERQTAG